jgi:dTMP kinase
MTTSGHVIAFEGLDQSGKETQARLLGDLLRGGGHQVHALSFPDYDTAIGSEIGLALRGGREYGPDVMQLLYVANRYEKKPLIEEWLNAGAVVLCDRYMASSVAYGEAHQLDPHWLTDMQQYLPPADVTFLLDIAPETAAARKAVGRDRYERDLALLGRVRASYARQARQGGWIALNGEDPIGTVAAAIAQAIAPRLAPQ